MSGLFLDIQCEFRRFAALTATVGDLSRVDSIPACVRAADRSPVNLRYLSDWWTPRISTSPAFRHPAAELSQRHGDQNRVWERTAADQGSKQPSTRTCGITVSAHRQAYNDSRQLTFTHWECGHLIVSSSTSLGSTVDPDLGSSTRSFYFPQHRV